MLRPLIEYFRHRLRSPDLRRGVHIPRARRRYLMALPVLLAAATAPAPNVHAQEPVEAPPAPVEHRADKDVLGEMAEDILKVIGGRGGAVLSSIEQEIREEIRSEFEAEMSALRADLEALRAEAGPVHSKRADARVGIQRKPALDLGPLFYSWLVLSLAALLAVVLAPGAVDGATRRVRRAPGRSTLTGMAAGILIMPVFVMVTLALALSVIGIIAIPFWVVVWPVAVLAAGTVGLAASAAVVAERLGDRYPTSRFMGTPVRRTVTGVSLLLAPMALAMLSAAVGIGVLAVLFTFAALAVLGAAGMAGLGGVLIALVERRRSRAADGEPATVE